MNILSLMRLYDEGVFSKLDDMASLVVSGNDYSGNVFREVALYNEGILLKLLWYVYGVLFEKDIPFNKAYMFQCSSDFEKEYDKLLGLFGKTSASQGTAFCDLCSLLTAENIKFRNSILYEATDLMGYDFWSDGLESGKHWCIKSVENTLHADSEGYFLECMSEDLQYWLAGVLDSEDGVVTPSNYQEFVGVIEQFVSFIVGRDVSKLSAYLLDKFPEIFFSNPYGSKGFNVGVYNEPYEIAESLFVKISEILGSGKVSGLPCEVYDEIVSNCRHAYSFSERLSNTFLKELFVKTEGDLILYDIYSFPTYPQGYAVLQSEALGFFLSTEMSAFDKEPSEVREQILWLKKHISADRHTFPFLSYDDARIVTYLADGIFVNAGFSSLYEGLEDGELPGIDSCIPNFCNSVILRVADELYDVVTCK